MLEHQKALALSGTEIQQMNEHARTVNNIMNNVGYKWDTCMVKLVRVLDEQTMKKCPDTMERIK